MAKQKRLQNGTLVKVPRGVVVNEIYQETTPTDLIRLGLQTNVDLDKLDRLMKMQKEWEEGKARKAFFEAFGKFQAIAPNLVKNKQVSFEHRDGGGKTEYKYQELGDIASHIRQPLADVGLSYRWDQKEEGKVITVWCIISHLDGHQETSQPLSGEYDSSGKKNLIQQKASTITYLRRYTLTGMLGLSTMEADNDGKGGAKSKEPGLTNLPPATRENINNMSKHILTLNTKEEMDAYVDKIVSTKLSFNFEQWEELTKTIDITANAKAKKVV